MIQNFCTAFLTFIALSIAAPVFALDINQVDKHITSMLQKISALSQNQADDYDKLQDANVQLLNYIKKNSTNAQMMKAPLKEACVNGLTAFVSDDKKVRCYSWDTLTGGTMHFFYSLISYDAGNNSFKLKVLNPNDKETEEDPGSCFEGLDTIKTKDGKTVYLVRDLFIGSGMIHGRTITAYMVASGKLVEYPFFKTSKKTLKSINFGFGEYTDATEFVLSPDKKTLKVPLIKPTPDETGAATGKYLNYAFDGSHFVFKK